MFKISLSVLLAVMVMFSSLVRADALSSFIETSYVPVFDCPPAHVIPIINDYLESPGLTSKQQKQLTVRKTHAQICMGELSVAKAAIQSLLADDEADRMAKYYTAAIYQYAFIYDMQENDEKCNYYRLARDTSKDRFYDIYLGATLAYITDCSKDIGLEKKMADIYELLEAITKTDDKAAMAHAHNRIGLFYAGLGARQLAASQYLKAYEIGKNIYTYENQVPLLTSAMTSLLLSDDLAQVEKVLIELKKVVAKTESSYAQFYLFYSEAGFYISSKDYENLARVVNNWKLNQKALSDSISQGLFRWYSSVLCFHNEDEECLQAFINDEKKASKNYLAFVSQSKEYLLFMTEVYILLGDPVGAQDALTTYVEKLRFIQKETQNNARNIGTLNLHSKVLNLETELQAQQTMRNGMLVAACFVLVMVALVLAWFLRRKYLESKSFDSATGLLNSTAVISKIGHLPAPGDKRTNALAIFDIANFTEVNLTLGSTKSDYVLLKLANTFRQITRNSDLLGRFGPGQFILCLADIEEDAAQAFFERVKEALTNTFRGDHNGDPISVDSSMSIYYESGTFDDINEILDNMLLSLSIKSDS